MSLTTSYKGVTYDVLSVLNEDACELKALTNGHQGGWDVEVIWEDNLDHPETFHGDRLDEALTTAAEVRIKRTWN